ncbi:MAG TPA: peptide chain release factor 1 [Candidatus Paceibacterota bacterium]|jgi:peptide chain release factor 1|nr:peptide chain release factor 1 [Candidatus Paceibacterota bacterium]HRS47809.1 peptide chain release factor 1 [Candidatus Paceibacterota bacterium]
MEEKIAQLQVEKLELENKFLNPDFLKSPDYLEAQKKYNRISEIIETYQKLQKLQKQIKENKELIDKNDDQELINLAISDNSQKELEKKKIIAKLNDLLDDFWGIKKEEINRIFLEIRAGTGGDEAALFAGDLFEMYHKFLVRKKFDFKIISESKNELGGYKEIILEINGKNIYELLKNESGVHRVQRVPLTEKSGRVHTSTATVAIIPVYKNTELKIDDKDLETTFLRSSGPGGQNVNKLETAVRIKHLPTGITVTCQSERYQHQNREKALEILKTKLYQLELEKQAKDISSNRKEQIGKGERAEKIRTYNFPQDRITDHRLNKSFNNISRILQGELEIILQEFEKQENLVKQHD